MARMMHRYEVPVDDRAHTFSLMRSSTPTRVEICPGNPSIVEFWIEHDGDQPLAERHFRVFGTGQRLPDDAWLVGTTGRYVSPAAAPFGFLTGSLVWHLFEVSTPEEG